MCLCCHDPFHNKALGCNKRSFKTYPGVRIVDVSQCLLCYLLLLNYCNRKSFVLNYLSILDYIGKGQYAAFREHVTSHVIIACHHLLSGRMVFYYTDYKSLIKISLAFSLLAKFNLFFRLFITGESQLW